MKNKKYLLFLLIIPLIVIMVGRSFAANFDREITSIEFTSSDYPEAGGFHIEKSAKWIEYGKAQVTFDIESVMDLGDDYKDVILVIDVSGSMGGEKIAKVKKDAAEMVDLLLSDSHNRVALVEFETSSYLELEFTNDKERVLDKINHMYIYDSTNYNAALRDVDRIMTNYVKEPDRSVTLMFLTDGYPNVDIDNQIATYHLLKEKYPYMEINGVQYEMGNRIVKAIRDISDNQWSAFIQTLHNVLFDASLSPKKFSNFVLTDYIDNEYFYLESVDDIEINMGTVRLDLEDGTQKITWDLSNEMTTVSKPKMTINLSLKDKYVGKGGFFPTNKKETVVAKLLDKEEERINCNDTPVLSSQYNVIYDTNTPEGCSVNSIESEKRYPFKNVAKKNISLHCDGYNFRGWVFDSDDDVDITHINDDVFIMPGHDVRIVAIWDKITPVKSMSGEVKQNANTLFDIMRMSAIPDDRPSQYVTGENGIDFTQQASDTNGRGVYELRNSMVVSDAENVPIYYFRGQVDNDFVLFAGYCWQIVRTTPDKGVKLLFYGEPTGDNHDQCNGSARYLYVEQSWFDNPDYYYSSYDNYVLGIRGGYAEDGGTKTYGGWMINQSMYDHQEYTKSKNIAKGMYFSNQDYISNYTSSYYYSTSYTYDEETGLYSLSGSKYYYDEASSNTIGKYTLLSNKSNATKDEIYYVKEQFVSDDYWHNDYSFLIYLRNNNPLSKYTSVPVGTGLQENANGTYTLTGVTYLDFTARIKNYPDYKNKYMCLNLESTCEDPIYIYSTASEYLNISYVYANTKVYVATSVNGNNLVNPVRIKISDWLYNSQYANYKYYCEAGTANCPKNKLFNLSTSSANYTLQFNRYFGASVTWDGTKYHLNNTVRFAPDATHHYTCPELDQTECSTVYYVIATSFSGYSDSDGYNVSKGTVLKMQNGETNPVTVFNQRKEVQVDENKNPINGSYNSNFKVILDKFYENKLMDYDNYIDDAVWCNSRVATQEAYQNSFLYALSYTLTYDSGDRSYPSQGRNKPNYHHPVIKCEDKLDAYTVNDTKNGNGFLKHPIALITADEYILTGLSNRDSYIGEGDSYWYTMTPAYAYTDSEGYIFQDGSDLWCYGSVSRRVKPSIVLKPSIPVKSGNGTKDNPYQLDLD